MGEEEEVEQHMKNWIYIATIDDGRYTLPVPRLVVHRIDPTTRNNHSIHHLSPHQSVPLPYSANRGYGIVQLDRKIYVLGGYQYKKRSEYSHRDVSDWHLSDVYCIDVGGSKWRKCSSMISARNSPSAVAVNGKIYVFGGENHRCKVKPWAEVYDPVADTWLSLCPPPPHEGVGCRNLLKYPLEYSRGMIAVAMCCDGTHMLVYNTRGKSWEKLGWSIHDSECSSAVVDRAVYYCGHRELRCYDLDKKVRFVGPVEGLPDFYRNVYTESSYEYEHDGSTGIIFPLGNGELCLMIGARIVMFRVIRYFDSDGRCLARAEILSSASYEGYIFHSCFIVFK